MGNKIKNENLSICSKCGGKCCKKCGCDYSANDFKNCSYDNLLKELDKGDKSIVAVLDFKSNNVVEPFLYIRARNKNREIVDLISMKTECSQLRENGCSYDYIHRPFGGKNLTPSVKGYGYCKTVMDPMDVVKTWKPHQKTLQRLVIHYTGMNVVKKIREDVSELFYKVLTNDFSDVSEAEMKELKTFIPLLINYFPSELANASKKYNMNKGKMLVRK